MRKLLRRALRWFVLVVAVVLGVVVVSALAMRLVQPPLTALQTIRLFEGNGFERRVVGLEAISPHLPRAVIAAEDNLFCTHHGIDWQALADELRRFRDGGRPRGASTITMQLTKNLYLWPDRSALRKGIELGLAPVVDVVLPKRRQLELYLNHVELGPGLYGAEAAARTYFGKPAASLSQGEAAVLASLLPGPLSFAPDDGHVRRRARRIVQRMGQLGPLLDCAR